MKTYLIIKKGPKQNVLTDNEMKVLIKYMENALSDTEKEQAIIDRINKFLNPPKALYINH